jgi:hypothetical protein
MALLVRIYYNAVFGALGGLLGWLVIGVFFGGQRPPVVDEPGYFLKLMLWCIKLGAGIGGGIGYFVVSADAIRDRSLVRFCRLASYGVVLGMIGGALGMCVAEGLTHLFVSKIGVSRGSGLRMLATVVVFGFGWLVLGASVGVSEGVAARSRGKFSYGTIGGALGGFLGGVLYCLFLLLLEDQTVGVEEQGSSLSVWRALGLVITGACIGSLSALVQAVLQPASVKVLRGWQEGREYPLHKAETLLGRDEHADIALFRDMKVEKKHAFILRQGNRFFLINNGAPPENTLVNDDLVTTSHELQDGDRIRLGNIVLRFQMREAQARQFRGAAGPDPRFPVAAPVSPGAVRAATAQPRGPSNAVRAPRRD